MLKRQYDMLIGGRALDRKKTPLMSEHARGAIREGTSFHRSE